MALISEYLSADSSTDALCIINIGQYNQPKGAGGTRSPPEMLHRLQNQKWLLGGPKMANGVWKGEKP